MADYDMVKVDTHGGELVPATEHRRDVLQPSDEITLEHVSGVAFASKNALSANPSNGNIAFSASSVLVVLDPRYTEQSFIENPSSREITAITFSDDGRHVAYGENGVNPYVSVFNSKHFTQVNRFQIDGTCSVKALLFHPRSFHLVVIPEHDTSILIYEFLTGGRVAGAKWIVEPLAMTITKIDCTLVVCGHRKITCFSMSNIESSKYEVNALLDKRAILLGKHGNYTFVDIICGSDQHSKCIYTVTSCGYLCEIQSGDIIINQVLKISDRCFCVKFEFGMLFIGCDNGVVNICNPNDLTISASVSDQDMFGPDQMQPLSWSTKSDVVALAINPEINIITTLLSDQKRHSWHFNLDYNSVECSPVIPLDENNRACPVPKVITSHEMQCNLAQMLLQLEHNSQNNKRSFFCQKPTLSRRRLVNAIKITPDGKEIISGNKLGEIKIYSAYTGVLTRIIEAHNAPITIIELLYDDHFKLIASGGRDRVIFILDAAKEYHLVQVINDHSSAIISLSLVHISGIITLVSSSADGVILIRRTSKTDSLNFIKVGELPECVGSKKRVYNHSNGYIITGQECGRINLFPADPYIQLKRAKKIKIGDTLLNSVAIDPTGSFFVAYSASGQYVFHLQTGQQIATLCALPGFSHLSFSPDLNYLINSNDSGCKFLWRLPPKIVDTMKARISKVVTTSQELCIKSYMSCVRVCQELVDEEPDPGNSQLSTGTESDSGKISLGEDFEANEELLRDGDLVIEGAYSVVGSDSRNSCTTHSRSFTDFLCMENGIIPQLPSHKQAKSCKSNEITNSKEKLDENNDVLVNAKESSVHQSCDAKDLAAESNRPKREGENADEHEEHNTEENVPEEKSASHMGSKDTQPNSIHSVGDCIHKGEECCSEGDSEEIHSSDSNISNELGETLVGDEGGEDDADGTEKMRSCMSATNVSLMNLSNQHPSHNENNALVVNDSLVGLSMDNVECPKCVSPDAPNSTPNASNDPLVNNEDEQRYLENNESVVAGEDEIQGPRSGESISAFDPILENHEVQEQKTYLKSHQSQEMLSTEPTQSQDSCRIESFNNSLENIASILTKHSSTEQRSSSKVCDLERNSSEKSLTDSYDQDRLEKDILSLESEGRLNEFYSEFCRCMQLSNSQETYFLKDVEQYDLLNDIRPIASKKTGEDSSENDREKDIDKTMGARRAEACENDGEECSSDERGVSLRHLFLQWMLRKVKRERSDALNFLNVFDGTEIETHKKRNDDTAPATGNSSQFASQTSSRSHIVFSSSNLSTSEVARLPWEVNHQQNQTEETCYEIQRDSREFISRLEKPLSIEQSYSFDKESTSTGQPKSILDRIGGVADLFRNQDDYLRKLKKVRKNFEMSIHALSLERKVMQMEAKKHLQKE